jgi:hypothetical protein
MGCVSPDEEGIFRMSYQPPGPYPAYPQYPGGAAMPNPRPPLPQTVRRAFYCMLAGATLTLVNAGITIAESGRIKQQLQTSLANSGASNTSVADTAGSVVIVMACFFAAIEIGLWIWMAYANKAGKNWARIVSTVFFGLEAAGMLLGGASYAATSSSNGTTSNATFSGSSTGPGLVIGVLTFLVGLATIILLWNKASGPYFKPQQYLAYPPAPYTYPVMPGQPMQPQQGAPQQPQDPWATPPSN